MSDNKAPKNNVFYRNQNWHYPKVKSGKGVFLYDDAGKEYLDGCSGSAVANLGHGNEEVAKHAYEQIKTLAFSHLSRFTTDAIEECADKIAELTPGDVNHTYFVSGGSEATETALKIARQYFVERDGKCSKWRAIARWPSFHGNTIGALAMTGLSGRRTIYDPLLLPFPKINLSYCYRCPYRSKFPYCDVACAYEVEALIKRMGPENVSMVILESVVGSAAPGVHPPAEYFKVVRDICTKHDVLMVLDEVMSGFGRTGKNFGIDHFGVVPDIITMAKGMSCGYSPLGAAAVNDEIFNKIMVEGSGTFVHGHTYGGNPLSASIANCVLDITKREGYIENSAKMGDYLINKLKELYQFPFVGDIRGKGLMIGIEFVKDRQSKEPYPTKRKFAHTVTVNCLSEGLIVYPGGGSVDGILGDHILIAPPINITKEEVDMLYDRLLKGFEKVIA